MPFGDDIFAREVIIGHRWSNHVARCLNDLKISCTASPLEIEPDPLKRSRFENEQDVVFSLINGHLEVKSRNLVFSDDPASFPYSEAFVDTVIGWDKKDPKPLAVVLVSQITKAKIVIPTSTSPDWGMKRARDRVRNISENWYIVRRSSMKPFSELVDWLLIKQERHAART